MCKKNRSSKKKKKEKNQACTREDMSTCHLFLYSWESLVGFQEDSPNYYFFMYSKLIHDLKKKQF